MNTSHIIFDCPVTLWAVLPALAIVVTTVVIFVRRDVAHLGGRWRRWILSLSAASALMLMGLLLGPKLIRTWPDPHKPVCTVLVDGSRSMLLNDTYDGKSAEWLNRRRTNDENPPTVELSRQEVVRLLLGDADGWLSGLRKDFELSGWRFASKLEGLSLKSEAPPFEVSPEGFSTPLGDALEQSASASGGSRPRVVILISDGAWNTGRDPTEIAAVLGGLKLPVYVIGVGNPNPPRDVAVLSLRGPKSVLLGDEVFVTAQVAATGMGATRLKVQLLSAGEVVQEKEVVTLPSGRPVRLSFSFVPRLPGRQQLTVRISKQENETDETNNHANTLVEVVERKINILLIDREPRWEFRFIRNVFERDPAVSVRVCLMRPGVGAIKGPGYVHVLPTEKKDFAAYDLVILGDVGRGSLSDAFLSGLSEMVQRRGGALVVVAGRRGYYRELVGTPIDKILPVKLEGALGGGRAGQPFRPELSQEGLSHLVTRLSANAKENELSWSRLPRIRWSAQVAGLSRGATPLVVHPYRLSGITKLPLVAVHRAGAGKVMFMGIEETWRWRKSVGDKYHYRFWAQAVRWMVKRPFAEGDPRARLSVDRSDCTVGEKVEVEAYCLGPDGFPLEGTQVWLKVTGPDGTSERLVMESAPGGWGIYRTPFVPTRPGKFRMAPIVSTYGEKPLSSSASLEVSRADLEKNFLAQDRNTLSAVAQASEGNYHHIHEVDKLPATLAAAIETRPLRAEFSPCRHWVYYLVLALTLGAVWLIRKRSGLA